MDGTADEVGDVSGSNNHGTSQNGADTVSDSMIGRAGSFDGVNDYVNATQINSSGDITIEAWIYPRSYDVAPQHNPRIFMNYDGTNDLQIILREANNFRWGTAKGSAGADCSTLPSLDAWTHITVTRSGATYKIYYNGVEQSTNAGTPGDPSPTTQVLRIGADIRGVGSDGHFNGEIDEVRVYNRALSAAEIKLQYLAEK